MMLVTPFIQVLCPVLDERGNRPVTDIQGLVRRDLGHGDGIAVNDDMGIRDSDLIRILHRVNRRIMRTVAMLLRACHAVVITRRRGGHGIRGTSHR